MLIIITTTLAVAVAASAPIQVESTLARESSNKATGFGKNIDRRAFAPKATSVSTASIRPDGTVELSCEIRRPDGHEHEHDEQAE